MPKSATDTALAVATSNAETGVVEWNLDGFPTDKFNRLVPVETLQIPTDLLRPVVQVVRLDPNPQAGDVYSSKDMPEGHAAPTRVGLRKLATAAGISFIEERRTDDGRDPDVIEISCLAEMLLPTGQRLRATGTKRVDLNAQAWRSDSHRAKFKSFFAEHVASRAQNRAIRALLSLRGSYPSQTYSRPFAVVSFAPNMSHPEVRSRVLDAMAGTTAQLYGPSAPQLAPGTINVTPAAEDDDEPPAPTQLPGERLSRAAATDEPDWFAAADPQPARGAPPPSLATMLRDNAESSGLKGPATEPQKRSLQELCRPMGLETAQAGFRAAFGVALNEVTAAQAQAVLNLAASDGAEFSQRWHAMAQAAA